MRDPAFDALLDIAARAVLARHQDAAASAAHEAGAVPACPASAGRFLDVVSSRTLPRRRNDPAAGSFSVEGHDVQ